jgi:hypothetical protein
LLLKSSNAFCIDDSTGSGDICGKRTVAGTGGYIGGDNASGISIEGRYPVHLNLP